MTNKQQLFLEQLHKVGITDYSTLFNKLMEEYPDINSKEASKIVIEWQHTRFQLLEE